MRTLSQSSDTKLPVPARHWDAENDDRRSDRRFRTVYRIARVQSRGDLGLARVHNISDEGMMLSLLLDLEPGDRLRVELSEHVSLAGTVRWRDGERCGLQLWQRIDSAAMVQSLYEQQRRGESRPLRLAHGESAILESEDGFQIVQLRDLSQTRMKIACDKEFRAEFPVKVQLTEEIERRGVVRWAGEGAAGIFLTEQLSAEDLGSLRAI